MVVVVVVGWRICSDQARSHRHFRLTVAIVPNPSNKAQDLSCGCRGRRAGRGGLSLASKGHNNQPERKQTNRPNNGHDNPTQFKFGQTQSSCISSALAQTWPAQIIAHSFGCGLSRRTGFAALVGRRRRWPLQPTRLCMNLTSSSGPKQELLELNVQPQHLMRLNAFGSLGVGPRAPQSNSPSFSRSLTRATSSQERHS